MYVCVYVLVYVRMYACVCVYVCIYVCIAPVKGLLCAACCYETDSGSCDNH